MKKTAILIIDKDRRIREKIDFLKLKAETAIGTYHVSGYPVIGKPGIR